MADRLDALVLDLLEWLAPLSRPYTEVMAAWRTSCPQLPVWETATNRGLVAIGRSGDVGAPSVSVTEAGHAFLARHRPASSPASKPAGS